MAEQQLARIVDPQALDRATGSTGVLQVEVLAPWLASGAELDVTVPQVVRCARCGGGGCDGCGRSGALRGPASKAARTVRLRLPADRADGISLRLVQPFGPASIDLLLVELRVATRASSNVALAAPCPHELAPHRSATAARAVLVALLLAVGVLLAALFGNY